MHKCPRQEHRYWIPEDYFDVKCTNCGEIMEFFKEEESRKCRNCGQLVENPKFSKEK